MTTLEPGNRQSKARKGRSNPPGTMMLSDITSSETSPRAAAVAPPTRPILPVNLASLETSAEEATRLNSKPSAYHESQQRGESFPTQDRLFKRKFIFSFSFSLIFILEVVYHRFNFFPPYSFSFYLRLLFSFLFF